MAKELPAGGGNGGGSVLSTLWVRSLNTVNDQTKLSPPDRPWICSEMISIKDFLYGLPLGIGLEMSP